MQAAFYATPIIYPLAVVLDKSEVAAKFLLMNPVAQAIQDARYALVTTQTETITTVFGSWVWTLIPLFIVMTIFIIGTLYFRKKSKSFAENI